VPAPGTDRLFVTELAGKVFSFPDDPACTGADFFVDVGGPRGPPGEADR
jgi:hypothetical protein